MRVSSTPRPIGSIIGVSGILGHPPEPVIGRPFGRPGGGWRHRDVRPRSRGTKRPRFSGNSSPS